MSNPAKEKQLTIPNVAKCVALAVYTVHLAQIPGKYSASWPLCYPKLRSPLNSTIYSLSLPAVHVPNDTWAGNWQYWQYIRLAEKKFFQFLVSLNIGFIRGYFFWTYEVEGPDTWACVESLVPLKTGGRGDMQAWVQAVRLPVLTIARRTVFYTSFLLPHQVICFSCPSLERETCGNGGESGGKGEVWDLCGRSTSRRSPACGG